MGIPEAHKALDENGVPQDGDRLEKNAQKLLAQLTWHAEAMRAQKEKSGTP